MILFLQIKWESITFSIVDDVTIQPPPLCGPTNITNTSVMACLERNGNIVCNISVQQRSYLEEMITIFIVDCPLMLNVPEMKFIVYINGKISALSNDNGIITKSCINGVWPNISTIGKNDKSLVYINCCWLVVKSFLCTNS